MEDYKKSPQPWNQLIGLVFCVVYSWHTAVIHGHSKFSKIFPLTAAEGEFLKEINLHTVSQQLEVDDFTGLLTMDENQVILDNLTPFPQLKYKLGLLIHTLLHAPVIGKFST
jgi:hypothetical protein